MITPATMKNRRQELGLTQIDVSIAVGVSVPAYRLWEAGGVRPTEANERKLREALSLEMEDTDGDGADTTGNKAAI